MFHNEPLANAGPAFDSVVVIHDDEPPFWTPTLPTEVRFGSTTETVPSSRIAHVWLTPLANSTFHRPIREPSSAGHGFRGEWMIAQSSNACWSFSMPASVTLVCLSIRDLSLVRPLRCSKPASLTVVS